MMPSSGTSSTWEAVVTPLTESPVLSQPLVGVFGDSSIKIYQTLGSFHSSNKKTAI